MHPTLFDYLLWFVTPIVQSAVLLAMHRRKLHSLYPRFFAYTILETSSVPILALLMHNSYTLYYYAYYVNLGVATIVSLAVLYETSLSAMRQNDRSLRVLQVLWTAVALCGFVVLVNLTAPYHDKGTVSDAMLLTDRFVRILQIALLLGFILFSGTLRLSYRSFVFGIVLGFGFFATINTLVAVVGSHNRLVSSATFSRLNGLAYFVAVLIWLAYSSFGSEHPSGVDYSRLASPTPREFRKGLERNFGHPRMSAMRTRNLI
jgi:hypothetical protein